MLERAAVSSSSSGKGIGGVNGTTKKRTEENDGGDDRFSSQYLPTLNDALFWNSVRAKSADLLDSARILLANRIERDSKLLVSVGLFAWERTKRDVARALLSSGESGAGVLGRGSSIGRDGGRQGRRQDAGVQFELPRRLGRQQQWRPRLPRSPDVEEK